jgi:hypothetical protein
MPRTAEEFDAADDLTRLCCHRDQRPVCLLRDQVRSEPSVDRLSIHYHRDGDREWVTAEALLASGEVAMGGDQETTEEQALTELAKML